MRTTKTIGFLLILLISLVLNVKGATIKLDQKKGIWQSQPEKQIQFKSYSRVNFDFEKVPLKFVVKVVMFDDKIFILDNKRSELYVIDRTGKYLYTVGRPGQGPEDIEYGWDFCISKNKIFVLNSMPRRISVFKIDGSPLESIRLEDRGFTSPTSIEVDQNQDIIIGAPFDPLITIYNSKGSIIKTIPLRSGIESYKNTPKIGSPSGLKIFGDTLYHFDMFKGVVTSIDRSGNVMATFNAHSDFIQGKIKDYIDDSKEDIGKSVFTSWAHFCMDDTGKIYTLSIFIKKGEIQELFVYSKEGDFLYSIPLDFFKTMPVLQFSIYKNNFVFLTRELDLYIAK